MSLEPGTLLGPYEILAPIGKGGMGEVYKARDTRLGRVVAIKVSQEQFSERFELEARAVAALNHPHICALYDVGPNYLVMEYIEGAPLKGPLPLDQALRYATQICGALDAAHKKSIVHRDLKPGNVLIAKQGVKLLDFGLARMATDPDDRTLTVPGAAMGTPAYMSPEQWEGKPADARSDIYSLGCVVYEMLTGKRATEDLSALAAQPAALAQVLRTCIEKDPDERWQTAREVKIALERPAESAASPTRNPWRERALWIGVAVLLIGALWTLVRRGPSEGELVTFPLDPPKGAEFSPGLNATFGVPQFAVSPDGHMIVFTAVATKGAKPMLWRRVFGEVTPQVLPGTEGAEGPFWSPDSERVGFFAEGKLKKVPAMGGTVQTVVPEAANPRGAAWGPDDTILLATGFQPLRRVSSDGGVVTAASLLAPGSVSHRYPQFLPDGRHFIFLVSGGKESGIYVGSLDDMTNRLLLPVNTSAVYAPPGYLLYVEGDALLARPFDAERLKVVDQPFAVAEHVGRTSASFSGVSASTTGVIAYASMMVHNGRLSWFDRHGNPGRSVGAEGYYVDFRLSPNGKTLAASLLDPKTQVVDVWMTELERGGSTKLTTGEGLVNASPIWSADSTRVVFRSNRNGNVNEFFDSSANGGEERLVLGSAMARTAQIQTGAMNPTDWSLRAPYILFSTYTAASSCDLWLIPLGGEEKPSKFLSSSADEMHGNFSPDGTLVAYTSNKSGKFEVYVTTFPRGKVERPVSIGGGYEPRWRPDGGEIYYLSENRQLMAVTVTAGPSEPIFGIPEPLFPTNVPADVTQNHMHYVPRNDGQQFLINTESRDQPATPITVMLNWTAKFKK